MRAIHASNVMHSCICIKIDSVDGAQRQRSSPLDIIRVTAVDMMKVQLPRDGRAKDGRTDGDGEKKRQNGGEGRQAGRIIWVSAKSSKKTARPPSITIVIRSGQFAMRIPHLQLQRIWKMEGVQTILECCSLTEGRQACSVCQRPCP